MQRSGINCGNKLYDHAGITLLYGKLVPQEITTTTSVSNSNAPNFVLNISNIEKLNEYSSRTIRIAAGTKSGDDDKVYDFTDWVDAHPGGEIAIITHSGDYVLEMDSGHSASRWTGYAANNRILLGSKDQTIDYNNLPSQLKSDNLYNN